MADEPALKAVAGVGFRVELERKDGIAEREGLVRAGGRRGEGRRAPGCPETVSVPVEHGHAVEMPERAVLPGLGEREGREADLLFRPRRDRPAERHGDLLGAETDAQERFPGLKTPGDQCAFLRKKGIGVAVVNADRPAEHGQKVRLERIERGEPAVADIVIADGVARIPEHRLEGAEILEMDMANGKDGTEHRGRFPECERRAGGLPAAFAPCNIPRPACLKGPVLRKWVGRMRIGAGKRRQVTIELRRERGEPVFLALGASIVAEIGRGRLRPGDRLPGTRALARDLGLNRNTVDAAYHELAMQGWLVAEPARGTFVASDLPDAGGVARQRPPGTERRERPADPARAPRLDLTDGTPDPRLVPAAEFARAIRRALVSPSPGEAGQYGSPLGTRALREALADHLGSERGLVASGEDVIVTRGSQMALFLAASALVGPGDVIAAETPGYPLAWAAFRAAGARVVGVAVDGGGIDPEALEALARRERRLKAVYVTPHHQYPTTVTLGAARRLRLVALARQYGFHIVEDDYDHEYRFDGRPVLPIAARTEPGGPVVYVGSLSKLLTPGIRLGYALAGPALLRRMAERREAIDRQGDVPLEHALASLIADGTLRRHARKARRVYRARRDRMAVLLAERLGDDARFTLPAGGLAIWLRLAGGGPDAERWSARAAALGLSVTSGSRFALDASCPLQAFRLGFAAHDDDALDRAVDLLARARPG